MKQPKTKNYLVNIAKLGLGVASIGLVSLLLAQHITLWPLELLASQLPLLYMLVLIIIVVSTALLSLRHKARSHILLVAITFGLAILLPIQSVVLLRPAPTTEATNNVQPIRYATYNKLYSNENSQLALDHLRAQKVDVVSIQEITKNELTAYQKQLGLPYSAMTDQQTSAFGSEIAMLSRHPILDYSSINLGGDETILRSVVDMPVTGHTAVYTVHILPPFAQSQYTRGLQAFDSLSAQLEQEPLPTLLAGDFNTTVFSPKLRRIQDHLQLATAAHNPKCSWSLSLLCMRIDHIFYSPDFALNATSIGPDTGSDHRIVTSTLTPNL